MAAPENPMNAAKTVQLTTPSPREVVIERDFDAPRALVFDALTQPDLLKRWCGPKGWSMVVCDIDLKVGGRYRFVTRRPDGKEVGQRGTYKEIVRPSRIVNTESWEDWDPGEVLVTTELAERKGGTTLTTTIVFPSQEVRDMLIKSGFKHASSEGYEKLDACLAEMQ